MRTRLRLALVALVPLVPIAIGACADEPPAKSPRAVLGAPRPESARVALARTAGPSTVAPPSHEVPEVSRPAGSHVQTQSEAQLAEHFGHARPLSVQQGSASYYSDAFSGRSTASGAPYDPQAYTAAHRTLPFGTVLRVTRRDGGQVVYVRVTDRGPFGARGRILDLSRAAAERLGMLRAGVIAIKCEVMEYGPRKVRRRRR